MLFVIVYFLRCFGFLLFERNARNLWDKIEDFVGWRDNLIDIFLILVSSSLSGSIVFY